MRDVREPQHTYVDDLSRKLALLVDRCVEASHGRAGLRDGVGEYFDGNLRAFNHVFVAGEVGEPRLDLVQPQ